MNLVRSLSPSFSMSLAGTVLCVLVVTTPTYGQNPGHGQTRRLPTAVGLSGEQFQLQAPGRRRQTCARTEQHGRLYLDAAPDAIHRADLAPGGPWATTGYRS